MLRRSVTPLLIGTFILRASGGAATVVLGLFLAQLSTYAGHLITSLQVGLLAVAFYVTELSLAPFMGALSDRWGRRYFLIFGPLVGLVDVLLIVFTPVHHPLPYLLSLQVLAGVSSALQVPVVLGYLADYTAQDASKRMRVMSFFELATSSGIAAGVILGWSAVGSFRTFDLRLACFVLPARRLLYDSRPQNYANH